MVEKQNEVKIPETDVVCKRELSRSKIVKRIKLNLTIGVETTREWMKRLGFLYSDVHKHFYVDNHESYPNVKYRTAFSHRYLRVHEPYMPRWFQIPEDELVADIPSQKLPWVKLLGRNIPNEKIEFSCG